MSVLAFVALELAPHSKKDRDFSTPKLMQYLSCAIGGQVLEESVLSGIAASWYVLSIRWKQLVMAYIVFLAIAYVLVFHASWYIVLPGTRNSQHLVIVNMRR